MDNGRVSSVGFRCLVRRKSVDSAATRDRDDEGHPRLARKLSVVDLIAMGKQSSELLYSLSCSY